jgi:hypothetical protein
MTAQPDYLAAHRDFLVAASSGRDGSGALRNPRSGVPVVMPEAWQAAARSGLQQRAAMAHVTAASR